jgi:HAMP domain-containing protein
MTNFRTNKQMNNGETILEAFRELNSGNFQVSLDEQTFESTTNRAIAHEINTLVHRHKNVLNEYERVNKATSNGYLYTRAAAYDAPGDWSKYTNIFNECLDATTEPLIEMISAIDAVSTGNLDHQLKSSNRAGGELLRANTSITEMLNTIKHFNNEISRVMHELGAEGKLGGQAQVGTGRGIWKDLTYTFNNTVTIMTNQVHAITAVTTAVTKGDLSKKITIDARGEILELKNTINTMVDQLNAVTSEVIRVSSEVGIEGKLGGSYVCVRGFDGCWKDLTENVCNMVAKTTSQVRGISEVTIAVAQGDFSRKISTDVQGEFLELKNTINTMVYQLNEFATEIIRVTHEVGIEGKLSRQAQVLGVSGAWKNITDNINIMAVNQVREISQDTTIVRGDMSKKITADVQGEMLEEHY